MLGYEEDLPFFITLAIVFALVLSSTTEHDLSLEETDPTEASESVLELSDAVAVVQIFLCMSCACQAPLSRPFRHARRRGWHALRSSVVSITLLSGSVITLPARKLIGKERLRAMWAVIVGARAAEHRARAAERAQAREASRFRLTRAWFNEQFGSWQLGLSAGTRTFLALLLMLSADPLGQFVFGASQATPSQFATDPFASPASHSAHLAAHNREMKQSALSRLLFLGPAYFDSCQFCIRPVGAPSPIVPIPNLWTMLSPTYCVRTVAPPSLNISVDISISMDTVLELEDVPANTTVAELHSALSSLLGAPSAGLVLLDTERRAWLPKTSLLSVSQASSTHFYLTRRDCCGGNGVEPSHRRNDPQPEPVERPGKKPSHRWRCVADVERDGTGKNKGVIKERGPPDGFLGPTPEAAIAKREEWITHFLTKAQRKQPMKRELPPPRTEAPAPRAARGEGSTSYNEVTSRTGSFIAGPGRGHTFEACRPCEENPVDIPPQRSANWLAARAQMEQWRTARIEQLERELSAALERERHKDATIAALRERVRQLETETLTAAEEIASYVESQPILKQASHAAILEEHPEWKDILVRQDLLQRLANLRGLPAHGGRRESSRSWRHKLVEKRHERSLASK